MTVETIDLYSYFNINKPLNAKGLLTVYAQSNNSETGLKRERSAMLVLPGGGYEFVSFREGECVALAYLSQGFQSFVLDYSVGKEFPYPTQLREAAMAMIFIRENAKKYHVNPECVGAIGFSAGGHLCGCLATMHGSSIFEDLQNPDFIRPTAVVLSYPVTVYGDETQTHLRSFKVLAGDNELLCQNLSLDKHVTKFSSPAFMWHTVNDEIVPVCGTIEIAKRYNEHSVPFELHLFEDGQHGLSLATPEVNSPNVSVSKWFRLSINWLKNRGFIVYSN